MADKVKKQSNIERLAELKKIEKPTEIQKSEIRVLEYRIKIQAEIKKQKEIEKKQSKVVYKEKELTELEKLSIKLFKGILDRANKDILKSPSMTSFVLPSVSLTLTEENRKILKAYYGITD